VVAAKQSFGNVNGDFRLLV